MHSETLKKLISLKDELNNILENSETLLDSTDSLELQQEIEKNVINYITETIDEIDIILENIENGDYGDLSDNEYNFDY